MCDMPGANVNFLGVSVVLGISRKKFELVIVNSTKQNVTEKKCPPS
jgi:hypothetical protein